MWLPSLPATNHVETWTTVTVSSFASTENATTTPPKWPTYARETLLSLLRRPTVVRHQAISRAMVHRTLRIHAPQPLRPLHQPSSQTIILAKEETAGAHRSAMESTTPIKTLSLAFRPGGTTVGHDATKWSIFRPIMVGVWKRRWWTSATQGTDVMKSIPDNRRASTT